MKNIFKEQILLEITKNYPNWSNIIESAKQARNFEYPDDISGLYELSGLKEAFDEKIEKKETGKKETGKKETGKKEIVKDDKYWES